MRVHWLIPSIMGAIGILFFSLPAEAARLQRWQFDGDGNSLTFSTDEGVQPRVQLVTNPTRLVIDLPDTTFERSQVEESGEGAIREIRVAQFDETTTRIVIELNSGYTLDPQQVRVRGVSANQWTVQLPEPQRTTNAQGRTVNTPSDSTDRTAQPEASARIEDIQITPDGFFIRTTGEIEDIDEDNDRRPPRFILELEDTVLSSQIEQREIEVNQYGVERIELVQVNVDEDKEPVVRIILELEEDTSRWRANESADLGGISLNPRRGEVLTGANRELRSLTAAPPIPVPSQPIPTPEPSQPQPTAEIPLPNVSDSNVVIAIDPGHGGRDPGAVGIAGLEEAGIVLDIGQQVADLLEEQGVRVILTRQDDREIDLEPRVQAANRANADLFVSIHANAISLSRPDVNGIETYYYSDAGQRFAQVIHNAVVTGTDSRDRGVRFARFYVLRNTHMPAVLVEVGFVTGEEDAARLSDADFRQRMAESIAAGILQYVQRNF